MQGVHALIQTCSRQFAKDFFLHLIIEMILYSFKKLRELEVSRDREQKVPSWLEPCRWDYVNGTFPAGTHELTATRRFASWHVPSPSNGKMVSAESSVPEYICWVTRVTYIFLIRVKSLVQYNFRRIFYHNAGRSGNERRGMATPLGVEI